MFSSKTAWFSQSCASEAKDLWVQHGGQLEDATLAQFIFSDDWGNDDTKGFLTSPEYLKQHLAVFKSQYVLDAVRPGVQSVTLGKYFLVPNSILKCLSGSSCPNLSQGADASHHTSKSSGPLANSDPQHSQTGQMTSAKKRQQVSNISHSLPADQTACPEKRQQFSKIPQTSQADRTASPEKRQQFSKAPQTSQADQTIHTEKRQQFSKTPQTSQADRTASPEKRQQFSKAPQTLQADQTARPEKRQQFSKTPQNSQADQTASTGKSPRVSYLPHTSNRISGKIGVASSNSCQTISPVLNENQAVGVASNSKPQDKYSNTQLESSNPVTRPSVKNKPFGPGPGNASLSPVVQIRRISEKVNIIFS
ncbi:telomere repeats-binding bouquet formation protein 2 [Plakobranchus ocellatus]|uniref:Telomere repeats-binding bouquet formation protein 2 n=1 Tax=Plakobranchus ocellatus TaxID=259542 RepID=A0AAV4BM21_9GAST|nr:telomere repeats-binding bouquet formation protein 2 [Plakobranchus ocellatus]